MKILEEDIKLKTAWAAALSSLTVWRQRHFDKSRKWCWLLLSRIHVDKFCLCFTPAAWPRHSQANSLEEFQVVPTLFLHYRWWRKTILKGIWHCNDLSSNLLENNLIQCNIVDDDLGCRPALFMFDSNVCCLFPDIIIIILKNSKNAFLKDQNLLLNHFVFVLFFMIEKEGF